MPTSIIEQMIPAQQFYNELMYNHQVLTIRALYEYKEAKTLEDIYYNLEVLRRVTHRKIDNAFYVLETMNLMKDCGTLLIDRSDYEYKIGYDPYYGPNKGGAIIRKKKFIPPNPTT